MKLELSKKEIEDILKLIKAGMYHLEEYQVEFNSGAYINELIEKIRGQL